MYCFQLLVGKYQDVNGIDYSVKINRDDRGKVISVEQPVILSEIELDKKFMPGKFKKLSEAEKNSLLNNGAESKNINNNIKAPAPVILTNKKEIASSDNSDNEIATQNKYGNVTEQFPKAINKSLTVYKQIDGTYFVCDTSNVMLIDNLKSRIKVHSFIKNYKTKET
jgi:hypothetical protein